MPKVIEITGDNIHLIKDLYTSFETVAIEKYNFEHVPIQFDDLVPVIRENHIRCLAVIDEIEETSIAFLLYVIEPHDAIEINLLYVLDDYMTMDIEKLVLGHLVEMYKHRDDWTVISYAMLGIQEKYVRKITHVGFKLVGQAVVRFKFDDFISLKIVEKVKVPDLTEGYLIVSWQDKYIDHAYNIIHESFKNAPDARFDPRFMTLDGCKQVVDMIIKSEAANFLSTHTSVLLYKGEAVGICFANLTNQFIGNIPLIGITQEHRGKQLSKNLLYRTLIEFIRTFTNRQLNLVEINATVETDNFAAIRMYRYLGFREDNSYPHAFYRNPAHPLFSQTVTS